MAHIFDTTDDDNGDDLNDFERYLREKEKAWEKSPLELTPTDESKEGLVVVESVMEPSSPSDSSTEIPESTEPSSLPLASSADENFPYVAERQTKLSIHSHPIVQHYVTEDSVAYQMDAEWQRIFAESHLESVTHMTAEKIIERFHELDRNVFLIRAQQQGLRLALEEVLATRSYAEREQLLELDRKERVKNQNKLKVKIKSERAKASDGKTVKAASSKGKTKGQRGADTFLMLQMDKATTEKNLRSQGLLDEATQAYVNKIFA